MAWRLAPVLLLAGIACSLLSLAATAAPRDWNGLTPEQRQALAPLEKEWPRLEEPRRAKWLEVASRFRTMPPEERHRIQARMAEWAQLSPAERNRARLQFQETRQLPPTERHLQWQAFQSLSEEERRALGQRAAPRNGRAGEPSTTDKPASAKAGSAAPAATPKRNVVQAAGAAPVRPLGGATAQAKPGATTSPITGKAPLPPAHHQAGMPKIAATSGFVDPSTLLPRRGPQGAAALARAPASSDPAVQP